MKIHCVNLLPVYFRWSTEHEHADISYNTLKSGQLKHADISYNTLKSGQLKHADISYNTLKSGQLNANMQTLVITHQRVVN